MSFEELIVSFGYFAIFFLMTLNGFVSVPSSQILYIIIGVFVSTGHLNLVWVILIGGIANTLGNWILYEISRKKGLNYTLKFFQFLAILNPKREIKKIKVAFKKKGVWFLFIGKLINPIKIFITIPAGITKMNRFLFLVIVFITSIIWATIFTFIGFYFGKSYSDFGIVGVVMFGIFGIVMFGFYKYINSEEILKEIEE